MAETPTSSAAPRVVTPDEDSSESSESEESFVIPRPMKRGYVRPMWRKRPRPSDPCVYLASAPRQPSDDVEAMLPPRKAYDEIDTLLLVARDEESFKAACRVDPRILQGRDESNKTEARYRSQLTQVERRHFKSHHLYRPEFSWQRTEEPHRVTQRDFVVGLSENDDFYAFEDTWPMVPQPLPQARAPLIHIGTYLREKTIVGLRLRYSDGTKIGYGDCYDNYGGELKGQNYTATFEDEWKLTKGPIVALECGCDKEGRLIDLKVQVGDGTWVKPRSRNRKRSFQWLRFPGWDSSDKDEEVATTEHWRAEPGKAITAVGWHWKEGGAFGVTGVETEASAPTPSWARDEYRGTRVPSLQSLAKQALTGAFKAEVADAVAAPGEKLKRLENQYDAKADAVFDAANRRLRETEEVAVLSRARKLADELVRRAEEAVEHRRNSLSARAEAEFLDLQERRQSRIDAVVGRRAAIVHEAIERHDACVEALGSRVCRNPDCRHVFNPEETPLHQRCRHDHPYGGTTMGYCHHYVCGKCKRYECRKCGTKHMCALCWSLHRQWGSCDEDEDYGGLPWPAKPIPPRYDLSAPDY